METRRKMLKQITGIIAINAQIVKQPSLRLDAANWHAKLLRNELSDCLQSLGFHVRIRCRLTIQS